MLLLLEGDLKYGKNSNLENHKKWKDSQAEVGFKKGEKQTCRMK